MSILSKAFRDTVNKSKDYRMKVETEADIGYSTGFLSYDFRNGALVHGIMPDGTPAPYYSIGITGGSMVMIIGRSGSGKTTWTVQAAANIIRPFKNSTIIHDDTESGITQARKATLARMVGDDLKDRYIHRNTGITGENFYERIKILHDLKINNRETYEYDTGYFDETGERIIKLEPSVYILDSLSLLMPEKYSEEDDLSGQMATTAAAKMNAMIFRRIVPMLKAANIILFVINHINQKVDINPMQRSKSQVSYLKQNETLPGGNTPIYLSNIMIRFDDHSKLKEGETYDIDGTLVDLTMVKSRNNKAGQPITLVFDQSNGFDPELSLWVLLKEHKRIGGAGAHLYIDGLDTVKFAQRNFKAKLEESPELRARLTEVAIEILLDFVYVPKVTTQEDMENDISLQILDTIMARPAV